MAARKVYHVATSEKGGWTVKVLAKKGGLGQIIVHGRNGRIQFEHSHGKDPRGSAG